MFFQITFKVLLFDRLKYRQLQSLEKYKEKKYYIPGFYYITLFISAFASSVATLALTYPFDVAFARATTNINYDKRLQKLSDCFITTSQETALFRYYSGLSFGIVQTLVHSTITFIGYQLISDNNTKLNKENLNYFDIFGKTSLISLIASLASYPLDTMKRRYQVYTMVNGNFPLHGVQTGNYYRYFLL
jgi:hypothetical protein